MTLVSKQTAQRALVIPLIVLGLLACKKNDGNGGGGGGAADPQAAAQGAANSLEISGAQYQETKPAFAWSLTNASAELKFQVHACSKVDDCMDLLMIDCFSKSTSGLCNLSNGTEYIKSSKISTSIVNGQQTGRIELCSFDVIGFKKEIYYEIRAGNAAGQWGSWKRMTPANLDSPTYCKF